MLSGWLLTVKVIVNKGRPTFLQKFETAMARKNEKRKYPVITTCQSVYTHCFSKYPALKRMQFQLTLNYTFLPTPPPTTH